MPIFHLILVAIIQGATEFLPVSSSGHLILLPYFTGLPDQGQVIDVSVHVGTLFAVILYFRRDVALCVSGVPRLLTGRADTPGSRLLFLLLVSTIPVLLAGLALRVTGYDAALRSATVVGWTMLVFGLLLYWADQKGQSTKTVGDWAVRDAISIGLMQALALIPGTSRSGVSITAARALGYHRTDAARISMLMSIPTISASGILLGAQVFTNADAGAAVAGAVAAGFSFLAALVALSLMMRILKSVSFTPYVIYRVMLGLILLGLAYS